MEAIMEESGVPQDAARDKNDHEWENCEGDIKVEMLIDIEETRVQERAARNESEAMRGHFNNASTPAHDHSDPNQLLLAMPTTHQRAARHDRATSDRPTSNTRQDTDTDDDSYNCDTCGKTFEQKHDLIQHIKKAATECIPLENYTYSENRQRKVPTGNKAFWCELCQKQFRDSSDIARHRRIHTGEKPYSCDICKKQFAQLSVLSRHKRIHTDEKPFKCDVCEKQFRASSDLGKHRRIHVGVKRFTCELCKKEFGDANDLANHKHIHKGNMPYSCEICKKQFAHLKYLKKHEKRLHS